MQGASQQIDIECEILTFEEYYEELEAEKEEDEEDDDRDEEDEEDEDEEPSELVKIKSIKLKALCNQYNVCISRKDLEFQFQVVNPITNLRPVGDSSILLFLSQEEGDGISYDVGMGNYTANDLIVMEPNYITASIGPFPDDDCHSTGSVCGQQISILTSNPIPEESTGAYLALELPPAYDIAFYECKALLEFEELICATTGPQEIQIRVPTDFFEEFEIDTRLQYEITVELEAVQLPHSTVATRNVIVESFERFVTDEGNFKFSEIDSNRKDQIHRYQILTDASPFKKVQIVRSSTALGETGTLDVTLAVKSQEALAFSDLKLEMTMPLTAGYFKSGTCRDSADRVQQNACRMMTEDTILVSNLTPFCSESELTCRFTVGEVVNADFATTEPHNTFDSFQATLYYDYRLKSVPEKALVHQSSEGIFAEPQLKPWKPTITAVSL